MMNTLVVVNDTDITEYVNWKTYSVYADEKYEAWEDGNFVEHRVYTRSKLKGSFTVWLCEAGGMSTDDFLELWNGAVQNNVVTIGLFDMASNSMKAIEAYYDIKPSKHRELSDGQYFDLFKIEVTER